jgi:uncharacterized membrane protein YkvA (DUF1232 family)
MDMDEYDKHYSDDSFWDKLKRYAAVVGKTGAELALMLYFCLRDAETPMRAKSVIAGALGYFILPLDAIPDVIPAVGFSDDLGALTLAVAIVAAHIKDEHRQQAKETLAKWFGPGDDKPNAPPI